MNDKDKAGYPLFFILFLDYVI